jgi:4-hydroxy-tetrahydrodipicolinate synthase
MPADPVLPDGVYAACVTPMHDDLTPDIDALVDHARRLLAGGCDGLLLFGTTGEAYSFTAGERITMLDELLRAGLSPEHLMVGTGGVSVPDAVMLTQHAVRRGIGGALVLPPVPYRDVRDAGLFRAYAQLIREVDDSQLRLYLYHFPALSGTGFSHSLIERLCDAFPNTIAGIKDSSGDWMHISGLCQAFPDLQVFSGTERFLLDLLGIDGAGCISATVNLTHKRAGQVYAQAGTADANAPQEQLSLVRQTLAKYPTVPALKHALALRDDRPAWRHLRPPLTTLSASEAETLGHKLRGLDVL